MTANPASLARVNPALEACDAAAVTLRPGRFRDQMEQARQLYGGISNDSVLKGFRREAGLPAPGEDMKGWCAADSAGLFGQLLSGLVRLGRATGDDHLVAKARDLFAGWRETLSDDGNPRMRLYAWEKLVCGLVDLHHAGVADALPTLRRTTEWALAGYSPSRQLSDTHDFWGAGDGGIAEWYTLPENLYRAYFASGDAIYRTCADTFRYHEFWQPFATSSAGAHVQKVHAYSHVNSFSSAAMAYAVGGDKTMLRVCENAYDYLVDTQCYATGGYGPEERLMPPDGSLGHALDVCGAHAEIPCGSWAAIKLSRYLTGFTGAARFGDWVETILINAMGAALPPQPDGHAYYYGDYSMSGGTKQFYWHEWPCCAGTYLQTVADYPTLIYSHAPGQLCVNQFVPSEVAWEHGGQTLRLTQETRYPEEEAVVFRLAMAAPARFALRIRVPGWVHGAAFTLNGAPVAVDCRPGEWAVLDREWQPGDVLSARFPMALRAVPVDPQHGDRVAILYGPIVLAQDEACCRRPFTMGAMTSLESRLLKEEGPLRFRILNLVPELHTRYLQPLYSIPGFWPYWVYFDLHAKPLF